MIKFVSPSNECRNYTSTECSTKCAKSGQLGELFFNPDGCPWMGCKCTSCIYSVTLTSCSITCLEQGKQMDQSYCISGCCLACVCTCQSYDYDSCQSQCRRIDKTIDQSYCSGDCCSECECSENNKRGMRIFSTYSCIITLPSSGPESPQRSLTLNNLPR